MFEYEYIEISDKVASVVEPKVHLASVLVTVLVSRLREQEREPLAPFTILIVPLGLSTGSPNTKRQRQTVTLIIAGTLT